MTTCYEGWDDANITTNPLCSPCNAGCHFCTGPGINECSACSQGWYHDKTTTCLDCDAACAQCTGPLINECQRCRTPTYFLENSTTCMDNCTGARWEDGSNTFAPMCRACDPGCSLCYGPLVAECTECIDGYYLDGSTCKKCGAKCATCYDVNTVTGNIIDMNNVAIVGSANYGGNDTCSRCNWGYFLDVAINTTYPSVLDTGRTCLPDCTVNTAAIY